MSPASRCDLAGKYFVDDLPGAKLPGARLHGILEKIDAGQTLSALAMAFLTQNGLKALHDLATGVVTSDAFHHLSVTERDARIAAAREQARTEAAAREKLAASMEAAIEARFEAMANDPILRRKREARDLRDRYGLGFVDPAHYPRVMKLVKQVEGGRRLSPDDVIWLSTEAEEWWTPEFRSVHHRLEAQALTEEWERTGDPWAAVNASGHWRKSGAALEALKVTETALAATALSPKLHSALCTTRGGAMRDLGRLTEALDLGHEARRLAPKDYRPCTLLGAVNMELGEFATGQEWYGKAEKLGAERHAVDQDLRGILARAAPEARQSLCSFLLSQDEHRFAWVRKWMEQRNN